MPPRVPRPFVPPRYVPDAPRGRNPIQAKATPYVPPRYVPPAAATRHPIQQKATPYVPLRYVPPAPATRNPIQRKAAPYVPPRYVPPTPASRGAMPQATIQLLSKRWKNVLTLGGRKAYVEIKRAVRAHNAAAAAVPVVAVAAPLPDPNRTNTPALRSIRDAYDDDGRFSLAELQEHVTAYEHARYFQATKDKNIASIMSEGLDRKYGGQADGASATADPGSVESNKGKIFLGGDRNTALYYERQLRGDKQATPETVRVFLNKAAAETMVGDFGDTGNEAYWTAETDIPPEHILRGRIKDASHQQLTRIFSVVRQWYPDPASVTVDEVIARHMEAIERGLTAHAYRPGGIDRGRFVRDVVRNPRRGIQSGFDEGYESD